MSVQPVSFGIVGCGNIARTHASALARLRDRGEVKRLIAVEGVVEGRRLVRG